MLKEFTPKNEFWEFGLNMKLKAINRAAKRNEYRDAIKISARFKIIIIVKQKKIILLFY